MEVLFLIGSIFFTVATAGVFVAVLMPTPVCWMYCINGGLPGVLVLLACFALTIGLFKISGYCYDCYHAVKRILRAQVFTFFYDVDGRPSERHFDFETFAYIQLGFLRGHRSLSRSKKDADQIVDLVVGPDCYRLRTWSEEIGRGVTTTKTEHCKFSVKSGLVASSCVYEVQGSLVHGIDGYASVAVVREALDYWIADVVEAVRAQDRKTMTSKIPL